MKEEEFALIKRILEGETECYSYFVSKYSKDIFQLAFQLTSNREMAEDLTQDVFLKGFMKLRMFQQKSQFLTWLYRLAYNLIINELRKMRQVILYEEVEDFYQEGADTIDVFFNNDDIEERYLKLDKALKILTKDEYALIYLHYYQQKTVDDIAYITDQTSVNVKVKLFRIRKKLYRIMDHE